jgi:hypothetical protein
MISVTQALSLRFSDQGRMSKDLTGRESLKLRVITASWQFALLTNWRYSNDAVNSAAVAVAVPTLPTTMPAA